MVVVVLAGDDSVEHAAAHGRPAVAPVGAVERGTQRATHTGTRRG